MKKLKKKRKINGGKKDNEKKSEYGLENDNNNRK